MSDPLLTIDAVTFNHCKNKLRVYLSSLVLQTDNRFLCRIWHDGPADDIFKQIVGEYIKEYPHIFSFHETEERKAIYGHNLRSQGLNSCTTKYFKTDNMDNYNMPRMVEFCLSWLENKNLDLIIFDIVHNYANINKPGDPPYSILNVRPGLNACDAMSFVAKTDKAKQVGWGQIVSYEDGLFINKLMGIIGDNWDKIPQSILSVHN